MATFDQCCEEVNDRLKDLSNLLVEIGATSFALSQRLSRLEQRVGDIEFVFAEIAIEEFSPNAPRLWLNRQFLEKSGVQVALLSGLEFALREGGVGTRQIFVSILADALGRWLLDAYKSAVAQINKSVAVDPEGEQTPTPTPQFLTILEFAGIGSALEGSITADQATLDGGSDRETGGSAAYGTTIGATGKALAALIGSFSAGLAEGLAKALKTGKIIAGEVAKKEEDPIWAEMRRTIFGFADPPPLTSEEEEEILSTSGTQIEGK